MSKVIIEHLENNKFSLLNHSLEINEYKKHNKSIPVESYEHILELLLQHIDSNIESEKYHDKFKREIGTVLGVKF